MILSLLIIAGIILMGIAMAICVKLIAALGEYASKMPWYILLALICFFLIGYVVFLYVLSTGSMDLGPIGYLLGGILFFGSVFVVLILTVNYQLIRTLNHHTAEIIKKNSELQTTTDALSVHKSNLEQATQALTKKNKELDETLEEFYTMRVGMLKDMESGTVAEENKRIRERIDALKSQS